MHTRSQIYVRPTDYYHRILCCHLAGVAEPARFGNDCVPMQRLPRFYKKGRHENSSRQRSGHSGGALVGREDEPEGSFAELLLRLGPEFVIEAFLLLVVFSSTCTCAAIRMRSVSLILAIDLKYLTVIGLFDFLEWNEAHIVATILRRLE